MVPLLSALSLALCHEVLEGGGYQQKETSPVKLRPRLNTPQNDLKKYHYSIV